MEYKQTSKLRRKMRTELSKLGDKIQVELSSSLNDIRQEFYPIQRQLKRCAYRDSGSYSVNVTSFRSESR